MRTVVLASLRHQARRYLSASIAIAVAVAFVVAVNALSAAARDGARDQVAAQYRGADLVLAGDPAGADDLESRVRDVPGVAATSALSTTYTEVTAGDTTTTRAVGSVAADPGLRWQRLASGAFPTRDDQALVSPALSRSSGATTGDRLRLRLGGETRSVRVSGVTAGAGASTDAVYVPAAALAGGTATITSGVAVRTDGDAAVVADRLRDALGRGSGVEVRSVAEQVRLERTSATQGVDVMQNLVLAFALLSAFVGVLVIANTFSMLLAQRSRDFALLRCVGSTRRQLVRSVTVEALALSVAASVVGVLLGWGLAAGGSVVLAGAVPQLAMGDATPGVLGVVVPVIVAVVVTVLASWLPARRVSRMSPLAALRPDAAPAVRSRAGVVRILLAATFLALGGAGLGLGTAAPSLPVAMLGGMVSFVGVLLLGPVLVPALVRLLGPVAGRLGVPGRVAVQNAVRNPRRTASTSAALLVGVTLVTTVVVGTASVKGDLGASLDDAEPLDAALTSTSRALPSAVVGETRRTDGVSRVAELPGAQVRLGSRAVTALGVDDGARRLAHGSSLAALRPGTALVPWDLMSAAGLTEGRRATLTGADGRRLDVVVEQAPGSGAAVLLDPRDLRTVAGGATDVRAAWVRADAAADATAVTSALTTLASTADVQVDGGLPTRAEVLRILDVVLTVTVALLAVSVVIALVGVGNTLSLSVLERTRESALLRALGLGRRGLRRAFATEAVLMALVATVLGVGLGVVYAWCGVVVLSEGLLDGLAVPWTQLAGVVAVAVVAGLLASVLPARRAARVPPAAGLVAD